MKDLILYHGSRGGISGSIKPISRERCDFGKGFYMGTNPEQTISLVSGDPSPYFYKVSLNLSTVSPFRIAYLKDMDWAYYVLYNRGKLESLKNSDFYNRITGLGKDKDFIVGPIADDAMNESMKRFINNQITDKAFLESIKAIDYGTQYVAKTEFACSKINIIEERELYDEELDKFGNLTEERRKRGHTIADEMQMKYLGQGLFFAQILEKLQKNIDYNIGEER